MTLTGVMLLSGVITMLSAEGALKKYVRLLCGFCLLCALITPLFQWSSRGEFDPRQLWDRVTEEGESDEVLWQDALAEGSRQAVENELKTRLCAAFELPADSLTVAAQIVSKNDRYELESVTLLLEDSAIFADPKKMIGLVEELGHCRCVVIYE